MKRKLFWLVALAIPVLAVEAALRLVLHDRLGGLDERHLAYRHDERLGWFPVEGSSGRIVGLRSIAYRHNRLGFRDVEHGPKQRPRLAVLGDSFVWGYDAEQDERLTDQLQRWRPDWEVLNLGVSGYGTDQELLLLQRFLDRLAPDAVFLVYSGNDGPDNRSNFRYDAYKPYFLEVRGELALQGVPVPRSVYYHFARRPVLFASYWARAFAHAASLATGEPAIEVADPSGPLLEAMRVLLAGRGARFAVGFTNDDAPLIGFCQAHGIPYVMLDEAERYQGHGRHWTPRGHVEVARRLLDLLPTLALAPR